MTACDVRLCSSDAWFQIKVLTTHPLDISGHLCNCHCRNTQHIQHTDQLASYEILLFSIGGGNRVGCRHWHSATSAEGGGKCQSGTRAGLHCQEILS